MKIAIIILLFCVVGYSIAFDRYGLWCYYVCRTSQLCRKALHLPCFKSAGFEEAFNKTSVRTLDPENGLSNSCVEMYLERAKQRNNINDDVLYCELVDEAWVFELAHFI